ncbi:hypothetical protein PFJ02_10185 [Mycobacterium xenopi]|uniref:hypothetical protein n=1 Tax=Mycobacterium xenopi TaxID=1789 RepID=UPI00025AE817|nr:hypothetical protein [Mycobacterium xenopi]EID11475.1 hypothetical protein MXEN_15717 [Mycobacterium xenopi RIVM700367]MDA3662423.1 hypothetical protein [Mycobacterium xenopi]
MCKLDTSPLTLRYPRRLAPIRRDHKAVVDRIVFDHFKARLLFFRGHASDVMKEQDAIPQHPAEACPV